MFNFFVSFELEARVTEIYSLHPSPTPLYSRYVNVCGFVVEYSIASSVSTSHCK